MLPTPSTAMSHPLRSYSSRQAMFASRLLVGLLWSTSLLTCPALPASSLQLSHQRLQHLQLSPVHRHRWGESLHQPLVHRSTRSSLLRSLYRASRPQYDSPSTPHYTPPGFGTPLSSNNCFSQGHHQTHHHRHGRECSDEFVTLG